MKCQPIKRCSCRQCKRGLHKGDGGWQVQRQWRRLRRQTKAALRLGIEPPKYLSAGYTD